jgi:hypothetical protein
LGNLRKLDPQTFPRINGNSWSAGHRREHINCFSWRDKILDWKRFEAIPDELDRRIAAGPGLDTIDYLWDEFETVSTYGLKYSSKYRPTPARWEEWQRDRAPTPLASPHQFDVEQPPQSAEQI